ncbi:putative methyltransferase DDB_G0268948 [Pseudophryne corroboree]|uniref:putative methyltransferase DDB_G0268948 n=1 Tax=Pseudophryne corroboree TaxID=495146 RepID=UPI00308120A2
MAVQLFIKKEFSSVYHKYMIPVSNNIMDMILTYVKDKQKGKSPEMALDVGCGTGRYTLPLAPHFKKVLGIDTSESQINLARQYALAENASYMVGQAEKLPLKDASVDLVNAGLAAHWFEVDKFVHEATRVLKTNGCLAVHAFHPYTDIEYGNLSEDLSALMTEVWDSLFKYSVKSTEYMLHQYQHIYEAVPLHDKKWITDIPVTVQMSILDTMGFIQAVYMYQVFAEKDPAGASEFLIKTEQKFREILGKNADSTLLNGRFKYYCILACKS